MLGFFRNLYCFQLLLLFSNIIFSAIAVVDPYSDVWGVTKINAMKLSYSWTISNYSLNDKVTSNALQSPDFKNDESDTYNWYILLYPNGYNSSSNSYVTISLHLVNGPTNIKVPYKMSIVDGFGNKTLLKSGSKTLDSSNKYIIEYYAILKTDLNNVTKNWLPEDRLTIVVDIVMNNGESKISGERCDILDEDSNDRPIQTFFEDELFSDIELRADGKTFRAHRVILAAYSSVFLKNFKSNPKQKTFDVPQIDGKSLNEVLRYIYTGKIENIERIAKELLKASDFLGISQLKSACEKALCKTINPTNAIEVLSIAELHNAKNLERRASKYIASHAISVVDSEAYKNLQISHPHPLFEIFRSVTDKNRA